MHYMYDEIFHPFEWKKNPFDFAFFWLNLFVSHFLVIPWFYNFPALMLLPFTCFEEFADFLKDMATT